VKGSPGQASGSGRRWRPTRGPGRRLSRPWRCEQAGQGLAFLHRTQAAEGLAQFGFHPRFGNPVLVVEPGIDRDGGGIDQTAWAAGIDDADGCIVADLRSGQFGFLAIGGDEFKDRLSRAPWQFAKPGLKAETRLSRAGPVGEGPAHVLAGVAGPGVGDHLISLPPSDLHRPRRVPGPAQLQILTVGRGCLLTIQCGPGGAEVPGNLAEAVAAPAGALGFDDQRTIAQGQIGHPQ